MASAPYRRAAWHGGHDRRCRMSWNRRCSLRYDGSPCTSREQWRRHGDPSSGITLQHADADKSAGLCLGCRSHAGARYRSNAAIFQLIDAVRLRTLPVKDPNTLAIVHLNRNHWGSGNFSSAYAEFSFPLWQQIRQRREAFSSTAGFLALLPYFSLRLDFTE